MLEIHRENITMIGINTQIFIDRKRTISSKSDLIFVDKKNDKGDPLNTREELKTLTDQNLLNELKKGIVKS
ncbi:MAG TPA: hypothetical protein ENI50_01555, partial [Euryarchaeota archaeon]|nr:hypothetical protein [Euryarchaeota archaeon]